ncbi:MAG TPA: PepSY domain-containing protein, partial [Verrucomicrobiae bacterium]|nr:PepSY domain-containing protein [Verrucomicrobiae bacterium]
MKAKMIFCSVVATALLVGCSTEKGEADHDHAAARQAKLMAKAKISRETAEQTAQTKVPNGTIKEAEIEKEHGKLIWSLDMTTPDTKEITEVNVDAITGEV